MSELQSFFASDSEYSEDEAQTSADLPRRVADRAPRRRARRGIVQALCKRTAPRRRRPPSALRQGPRCPVPVLAPLATGPRTPLPGLYEVRAPAEGNLLAHPPVLAHGPRPLSSKRSFTQ